MRLSSPVYLRAQSNCEMMDQKFNFTVNQAVSAVVQEVISRDSFPQVEIVSIIKFVFKILNLVTQLIFHAFPPFHALSYTLKT